MNARSRFSPTSSRERGSALLAALCFASVLALVLGSYLAVCDTAMQLSNRTLEGERGVQLAEAGFEQSLWALNNNSWSGWTVSSGTATKTLTGFSYEDGSSGMIKLTITNYNGSQGTLTAQGVVTLGSGAVVQRTLTATFAPATLFPNAAASFSQTNFNNGGKVDSYDSTKGNYSSPGGYSSIVSGDTVKLTNAHVYGYVATGGDAPTVGFRGMVTGPGTPAGVNVDPNRLSTNPLQPVFSVPAPTGAGSSLPEYPSGAIGLPTDTSPRLYYADDVVLDGNTLTVNGPVTLVLSGGLYIWGSGGITITGSGSLTIVIPSSGDIYLMGNGINNTTKSPKNLAILETAGYGGSPWYRTVNTGTPFYGVIYTPSNNLSFSGNASIYGAVVANQLTFSGSPSIHYDTSLRTAVFGAVTTPFGVSQVTEVTNGS